jgi:hypothetical protein
MAGLTPPRDPARPERQQAVNLLIAVRGAAGEVKMHSVLDRLGIGDRHEAHADGRVLVSPDDLVLPLGQDLPAKRLRLEPGQAGQIVSVNDDVVESDGHVRQYARHAGPYPGNPLFYRGRGDHRSSRHAIAPRSCDQPGPAAAREPSQLSTWPDRKTITESNRVLAYLRKISAVRRGCSSPREDQLSKTERADLC